MQLPTGSTFGAQIPVPSPASSNLARLTSPELRARV